MSRRAAAVVVVTVWLAAVVVALVVARRTAIGPAIAVTPSHGIHVGDVVALVAGVCIASAVTWRTRRKWGP